MKTLFWFRNDLRVSDNPGLAEAIKSDQCLLIYVIDQNHPQPDGQARQVWLEQSLNALASTIDSLGGKLNFVKGDVETLLIHLCQSHRIERVVWNRRYNPYDDAFDQYLKQKLQAIAINVLTFSQTILDQEPCEILNQKKQPYKVFTPYYNAVKHSLNSSVIPRPKNLSHTIEVNQHLQMSNLRYWSYCDWARKLMKYWSISEESAYQKMADFIDYKLHDYPTKRDFMAEKATSRLSPYLCHGQISLATIIDALYDIKEENAKEAFIRQLIWREFNYYSLWHFPDMQHRNFNAKFDHFRWENNEHQLKLWQNGQTGYPIVDAGMRQLYETGYMHNRVRMIVGSFLTKHLLIDWRYGKKWFWYTLLDGDSAVNAYNWQWVAGCGVDLSPFFRVFNPWLQARKFDPEADYIKYWVPELKQLSKSIIHKPEKLQKHYFEPLVQHQYARTRALARFKQIKKDK